MTIFAYRCPSVSMMRRHEWWWTGCCSNLQKPKSSGTFPLGVSISSPPDMFILTIRPSHRSASSETCEFTSTLRTNVIVTTRSCFAHTLLALICALVVKFQSVLSTAAMLVFSARRLYHITPLLRELHWLNVPEQIQFRLSIGISLPPRHSATLSRR